MLQMWDTRPDIAQLVESGREVPPSDGMLRLLVLEIAVGVIIESRCVADGLDVTRRMISAMPQLFREDEGVQIKPAIVEDT